MATKINPDYYGAENTFVNNTVSTKRSNYSIGDLLNLGIYTGGSLDFTASPWGIGKSSVSSDFIFTLGKSDVWSFHVHENTKNNTPVWFYTHGVSIGGDIANDILGSDATKANFAKALYKNRISPAVELASNLQDIKSTLAIDNGSVISLPSTQRQFAVTYADYQNLRAVIYDVWYKPEGSNNISRCELKDIINGTVTDIDSIIAIYIDIRERSSGTSSGITPSIGGSELDIPDFYKSCYYDSGDADKWVRPWHIIHTIGAPFWSTNDLSMSFAQFGSNDAVLYDSDYDTVTSNDIANNRNNSNIYGHISSKRQVFDDVAYHWEYGIMPYGSNPWTGTTIDDGAAYESGTYITYVYMALDGEYDDKTNAYLKAILHEVAFLGMPFTDRNHVTETIGGNNTYLPVFDEHLITTGDFVSGSASLALPNADWGDIFSTDMPDYDPEYEPEPEPDEGDTGDLSNTGAPRQPPLFGEITFYAMTGLEFYQFVKEVNAYYIGKTPDDWTLDFQGVNPAEYILGVYFTYFDLPIGDTSYSIDIGTITLPNVTAYKIDEGDTMLRPNRWQYCDFGTLTINAKYGDFRDYPPYTTIELYLPLAGTIDIDSSYFIGHNISIKYYYNILTMTGVACVYRDNLLYKTVDLKIASQIPLLSTNIGQYQNQIAQLANAREQNAIRLTAGALSTAAGLGATIATGGAALPALIAAGTGIATMATSAIKQDEISYQIEHTAPSLSVTGAAEANNALCCGQLKPKLIIKRAAMLPHDDSIYAQTVGNACCINDTIGNMSGLTVCSKIDTTGIIATSDEIQAIKQAFANGVIV